MLNKCFMIISIVLFLIAFTIPILAQRDDINAGFIAGEQAAKANANTTLWFFAGCCLNMYGVVTSYIYEPTPSAVELLGKSPEYVAAYTDAYTNISKSIQMRSSLTGLMVLIVSYVAVYVSLYVLELALT